MRALTEKQREALTELATGQQPSLYHVQYLKTLDALKARGLVAVSNERAGPLVLTDAGHEALTPKTAGRRHFLDNAEKQENYRGRKENELSELRYIRQAAISLLREQGQYVPEEGNAGIAAALNALSRF